MVNLNYVISTQNNPHYAGSSTIARSALKTLVCTLRIRTLRVSAVIYTLQIFFCFHVKFFRAGGKEKEYYTVGCLLYFLKNEHMVHPEYVKQAGGENVHVVRRPDRKVLQEYLKNEKPSTDALKKIDKSVKYI